MNVVAGHHVSTKSSRSVSSALSRITSRFLENSFPFILCCFTKRKHTIGQSISSEGFRHFIRICMLSWTALLYCNKNGLQSQMKNKAKQRMYERLCKNPGDIEATRPHSKVPPWNDLQITTECGIVSFEEAILNAYGKAISAKLSSKRLVIKTISLNQED